MAGPGDDRHGFRVGRVTQRLHGWSGCHVGYGGLVGGGQRSVCQGWTAGVARRNQEWLESVDYESVAGRLWAVTLTLRDCPESPGEWTRLVHCLLSVARKTAGSVLQFHWLTEWQRGARRGYAAGVPHLHLLLCWGGDDLRAGGKLADSLVAEWLRLAAGHGAGRGGQHVRYIDSAVGWAQYLSRHGGRGVRHYQRVAAAVPAAWGGRTGRVWAASRGWPVVAGESWVLGWDQFVEWRRRARAWDRAVNGRRGRGRRSYSAPGDGRFLLRGMLLWCASVGSFGVVESGGVRWLGAVLRLPAGVVHVPAGGVSGRGE